jgi:hypothetical protein
LEKEKIMGCDIHFHAEVKINGIWHHYAQKDVDRNYALFAKMANVRNQDLEIEPISDAKGLPEDLSFLTNFFYQREKIDAHSESWLSAEEIAILGEWIKGQIWGANFRESQDFGWLFGNSWSSFLRYREDYPNEVEDIRFVFWFDN